MLKALKYLLNISFESAIDIDLQRLYFHLDRNVSIVINYEKKASFKEDILEISETDLKEIANSNIQQVSFVSTEYLGCREDIPEFKKPESQSLQLFETIKNILSQDTNIISSYCIIDDYRYDTCAGYSCPNEPN